MKKLLCALALVALPALAYAEVPGAAARARAAFAFATPGKVEAPKPAPLQLPYTLAYWKALELQKPLVVWVGGDFCPS